MPPPEFSAARLNLQDSSRDESVGTVVRGGALMLAVNQIKERFVPGLVGVALFLALFVNVITKRNMCHDTGRSFEAAQIANMLRD
jgi:hypothetical protein